MFRKAAQFYDTIYSFKDYQAEAARVRDVVNSHARRSVATLLDLACGTGAHLAYLQGYYDVEGTDLDPDILSVARERLPNVTFTEGDMVNFELDK